ncbi:MAG TPA: DUF1993 domain-containing protein [Povalibacter sp.]|uniref:DUF1993 domain-containing protein n=1 Tax=Povalibacter sp. TaxID=1962978 RepID=UPI002BD8946A|nr:DUF1993 domain-containing protein [Povalibacter sp.]HMN45292.1 DUF1993 domain-containing protein [Povalibacter sp.]
MTTISMYEASIPTFLHTLASLKNLLQKGIASAEARKFDPGILAASRLAPDMFPLTRQVQIASDAAKGAVARLAGIEPPKFEDTETTLAELIARVDKTVDFIKTVPREQIDGSEDREIVLKTPRGDLNFKGLVFLRHWALPNFFFHVTTTYNLLRHAGVDIGKQDFLGGSLLR